MYVCALVSIINGESKTMKNRRRKHERKANKNTKNVIK